MNTGWRTTVAIAALLSDYLVYPYVEVDGKPLQGVTQTFTFSDLDRRVGH